MHRLHVFDYAHAKGIMAGIMLSEITPPTRRQGDLLEGDASTDGRLMQALDALN
jgi:hypothetical protein